MPVSPIYRQAALIKGYTRVVPLDAAVNTMIIPANSSRVSVGFLHTHFTPLRISTTNEDFPAGSILVQPQVLLWFHWEQFLTWQQQEFWCIDKVPGLSFVVYELLMY